MDLELPFRGLAERKRIARNGEVWRGTKVQGDFVQLPLRTGKPLRRRGQRGLQYELRFITTLRKSGGHYRQKHGPPCAEHHRSYFAPSAGFASAAGAAAASGFAASVLAESDVLPPHPDEMRIIVPASIATRTRFIDRLLYSDYNSPPSTHLHRVNQYSTVCDSS